MKTDKKELTGNGLFTMSRLGPEELTHKAVENLVSEGRRMQSVYVGGLFNRLSRLLGAVLIRVPGRVGTIPGRKRRRGIGIPMNRKFNY